MEGLPLRFRAPQNHPIPAAWRDRRIGINRRLSQPGDELCDAFVNARRAADARGDLAAKEAVAQIVERFTDLLPGEDGLAVAWAILVDSSPQSSWYHRGDDPSGEPTELFATPVPPYRSGRRGRPAHSDDDTTRRILALLKEGKTHEEVARLVGMTTKSFQRKISRLRREQGHEIPRAEVQDIRASFVQERLVGKAAAWFGYTPPRPLSGKTKLVPLAWLEELVGLKEAEIRRELPRLIRGAPVDTTSKDGTTSRMVSVPVEFEEDERGSS